jgi:hypothetical protein
MKTLIDTNGVAVFFEASGPIVLKDNGCFIGSYFNHQYNFSNATIVDVVPPKYLLGNCYKREGNAWVVVDEATVKQHRTNLREQFNAEQSEHRRATYEAEADPLFFMAQRGEATLEQWQAKIAEIKAKYPKEQP